MKTLIAVIALLALVACSRVEPQEKLKPWQVVCDTQGHYTFTDEKGEINDLVEESTYEMAARRRDVHRGFVELAELDSSEFDRIRKANAARHFLACSPPPTPTPAALNGSIGKW
jgi:hypothetical protein